MDPAVEAALISAVATLVSVGGTVAVAIVGFRISRSTNQATIDAARATADKTIETARDTNRATIDAAHDDVRRTLEAAREGQITELFTRAIDQLGHARLEVRIGGIYALERIGKDSAADRLAVVHLMGVFIRTRSRNGRTRKSTPKLRDGVMKRGNTWSYVIRVKDPDTGISKPKWVGGFATEEEAKAARDEGRVKARRGEYIDRNRVTVTAYLDDWIDSHAMEIKPRTLLDSAPVSGSTSRCASATCQCRPCGRPRSPSSTATC